MVRRKITFGDWLSGSVASLRQGTIMNPLKTQKLVSMAHDARTSRMFGAGEMDSSENWSGPVHATRADGRPVTIAFGQGKRSGQTLVADGHVSRAQFWGGKRSMEKGHDHFLVDGQIASKIDRRKST